MPVSTPRVRRGRLLGAVLLVFVLVAAGCGDEDTTGADASDPPSSATSGQAGGLADALRDAGLGTLADAVDVVGEDGLLDSAEFTVFAPNDDAFLAIDGETLATLLGDPEQLLDVLRDHVVGERLDAAAVEAAGEVETVSGRELPVEVGADGTITVAGAAVVRADIDAGGGVVHVIDRVLTLDEVS
jgi:uncharacterized surface protein with fasciclin (FAS1) repeats